MSDVELRHVEAGRLEQLRMERDQAIVERDVAELEDVERYRERWLHVLDLDAQIADAERKVRQAY